MRQSHMRASAANTTCTPYAHTHTKIDSPAAIGREGSASNMVPAFNAAIGRRPRLCPPCSRPGTTAIRCSSAAALFSMLELAHGEGQVTGGIDVDVRHAFALPRGKHRGPLDGLWRSVDLRLLPISLFVRLRWPRSERHAQEKERGEAKQKEGEREGGRGREREGERGRERERKSNRERERSRHQ